MLGLNSGQGPSKGAESPKFPAYPLTGLSEQALAARAEYAVRVRNFSAVPTHANGVELQMAHADLMRVLEASGFPAPASHYDEVRQILAVATAHLGKKNMTDDNSIPAPMLPEGVEPHEFDLQNFPTMPFDVSAFRDSEIQTSLSSEGLVAALNLWCGSWHQVPAGSLPNNPALLAKIAGYGKSLKAYQAASSTNPDKTIMEESLYGFKLCSDGRWWHPVVAKHAREAYSYKVRRKNQTSKATQARQDRAKGKSHDNHDNFDAPAGVMNRHDDTGNDTPMTDSVMTNGQSGDVMTTETRTDTRACRQLDEASPNSYVLPQHTNIIEVLSHAKNGYSRRPMGSY